MPHPETARRGDARRSLDFYSQRIPSPLECAMRFTLRRQPLQTALRRGLSLVELMCCLSVTASLLGTAVPGLSELQMRQRLKLAAAELAADVNLARSSAVVQGRPVRLTWQATPAGSCYMLHSGNAAQCSCDASGVARCDADADLLRTALLPQRDTITLSAATHSVLFDGRKGTVSPTVTFKLTDGRGRSIHQIVNILGRLRSCSPGGQVPGIKPC